MEINMRACATVCTCYGGVYNIHEYMKWMYLGMQRHRHITLCYCNPCKYIGVGRGGGG